jgi:phage anti-repressor protein
MPILQDDYLDGINTINAADLYAYLGLDPSHYARWLKAAIASELFDVGVDFCLIGAANGQELANDGGHGPQTETHLSLDMAKHLAMRTGGAKWHEVRGYFIKAEKAARQIAKRPTLTQAGISMSVAQAMSAALPELVEQAANLPAALTAR